MHALPFIAAGAKIFSGVAGLAAGNANSRALKEQAVEEDRASLAQREQLRVDARRKIGAQFAALGEGGLEGAGSGGTALDAVRESQIEAALDAIELRRQGNARSRALEYQAKQSRRQGRFALVEGLIGGGSDAFQISNDWAQDRRVGGGF